MSCSGWTLLVQRVRRGKFECWKSVSFLALQMCCIDRYFGNLDGGQ